MCPVRQLADAGPGGVPAGRCRAPEAVGPDDDGRSQVECG